MIFHVIFVTLPYGLILFSDTPCLNSLEVVTNSVLNLTLQQLQIQIWSVFASKVTISYETDLEH